MNPRDLRHLILKGVLAWSVLSVLVWYFGDGMIKALFPLLKAVMSALAPDFSHSLKLSDSVQSQLDASIELSAWTLRPIYLNAKQFIPLGTDLKASTHLLHILVPMVIEGSILFVWPVQRWQQRGLLIILGLVSAVLVILAILPTHLLAMLEISLQDIALTADKPRPEPWFIDWMVFCEMGGRWLLGVLAAWLCIQLQRELLPV